MSISEERQKKADEKLSERKTQSATAFSLMGKGYSKAQIAKEIGVSESTVRTLLNAPA